MYFMISHQGNVNKNKAIIKDQYTLSMATMKKTANMKWWPGYGATRTGTFIYYQ